MTYAESIPPQRPYKRRMHGLVRAVAGAAGLVLLTHLSWNLFAPGLFGLPELQLQQALGLVGLGSVAAVLLRHAARGGMHG